MILRRKPAQPEVDAVRYPGVADATDGSGAVVAVETAASEAAGAYPITPSTQMGEGWALAVASGETNVHGRRLLFFEPEGEHAAAAVTAGMSMVGMRATNFSSGQGIAYMHESLYPAVGKRLPYVLNVAARAITKHALNVHAGHDDYHAVDDTGFFQLFAKDVQEVADLTLISHRIAELSLNPGLCAQDGFLTSHVIESIRMPERELIREYLGDPADLIDAPTPSQRLVFGDRRRRIPEMFDLDYPTMLGVVQNQDSYAQGVAAQRPFYFDHIAELTDRSFAEYAALTGRRYERAMGYRLDDAEYVLAGQGSVVSNAEAVADYMREKGVHVGVLNLTMFRPFPADLATNLLRGRKAVTVLERVDQPLAVDPPLLRELRAAMSQGLENGRTKNGSMPFPKLATLRHDEVPDFYAAGFGFGSRDLQPGDVVAAVENMLPSGRHQRHYYLGIDFVRKDTKLPKLQIWQEQLLEAYPHLDTLGLESAGNLDLMPAGSISLRIHSIGGWGAITMGKNIALTAFELAGLNVKANPKYGSEKKGQPTTFYATLAHEPIRINAELKHVNIVLSPDANVFRHSNPLAGMADGGVFVIQSDQTPEALWASLPATARRAIRQKGISVYALNGFGIAAAEASDPELRYRMQGVAFMGAFFRTSPLLTSENLTEEQAFEGIRAQLQKKFGKLGDRVVEDNLRVIRRGYDEVQTVPTGLEVDGDEEIGAGFGPLPDLLDSPSAFPGIGNQGRFFEQICATCNVGQDVIADPFTAISAIPAATSSVRDMTGIRFEVPDFIPEKCTGCSQCWTQCPDSAIPGLVTPVEDLIDVAIRTAAQPGRSGPAHGRSYDRIRLVSRQLAKESRKVLGAVPFKDFGQVVSAAYQNIADRLDWDAERRAQLDAEFAGIHSILSEFPVALTAPFWDMPERKDKGAGGLLSITVNPEACKGCNICVDVCPENALITVRQDEAIVDRLRRNWDFWKRLPDTPDRFINVSNIEEGIGVLPTLLLKKKTYRSMVGGDGACMGCGEKTTVHLVTAAVEAMMQPRVDALVNRLKSLIDKLDGQARALVGAGVDLEQASAAAGGHVGVDVDPEKQARLRHLTAAINALKDLRWRYIEGPSGNGRAPLGITNSTGCSSVWASTFPYNPYPFPWVNHLFQDAPSIAIGIFEGHMRKMADAFIAIRRSQKLADGTYEAGTDEKFFTEFDWRQFDDDEFALCPPIIAIGGDGAMLDIGFQNLSRLMASGKPIRVMVLDTQVYSNTGGQACTSGFTGQIADMSAYGKAQHGKAETRKELSLIALAHRGVYVHQSSQATASHLLGGVLRGLQKRRPAIFNIYTPCPVEHGLPDEWAPHSARLALESRAFPFLTFDPDAGDTLAECLSLDGNPAVDDDWPMYELEYIDDDGTTKTVELPLTIADWAATENRFRKHFREVGRDSWNEDMVPFHEYLGLDAAEREGKTAYIHTLTAERTLRRLSVSDEIADLAHDRLLFWSQLREMAGLKVSPDAQAAMDAEFETRAESLRAEYDARIEELKATYPQIVARRLAEGMLRSDGDRTVREILAAAQATPGLQPVRVVDAGAPAAPTRTAPTPAAAATVASPAPAAATQPSAEAAAPTVTADDDDMAIEPWIQTELCTTCNECTNLNPKMFAYNENKQAYIKDPKAGTFAQLVQAAEKCPAALIHPGTPLNPKEKDLGKWIKRAEPFN
jgi:pyruvate-ferredoxin/flavodoxin oxidoreductase